ncbi:hypothetical protein CIB84_005434 [Bambusicola thoracicus]|uniref:Uncharacterized protein n=1 Tax=Bambusicola thoracicus TaxID=9083 RepID=A0A2P4T384_BAMTH|nr:hypothetical protein CIB84_005434 [Bambusicola thoracicus]
MEGCSSNSWKFFQERDL